MYIFINALIVIAALAPLSPAGAAGDGVLPR